MPPPPVRPRYGGGRLPPHLRHRDHRPSHPRSRGGHEPSPSTTQQAGAAAAAITAGNNDSKHKSIFDLPPSVTLFRDLYVSGQNIRQVRWNCIGTRLACIQNDRHVRVWSADSPDMRLSTELKGNGMYSAALQAVSWDPLNSDRLVVVSEEGQVREWDVVSKKSMADYKLTPSIGIQFSRDGKKVAVLRKDNVVIVLNRELDTVVSEFEEPSNNDIYDICWSNNSDYMACALANGDVRIVQVQDDEKSSIIKTLPGARSASTCLDFDAMGKYLAVGSNDGIVNIWELGSWICVKSLTKSDDAISSVSFSCDSNYLAIATALETPGAPISSPIELVRLLRFEYCTTIPRKNVCRRSSMEWHPRKYVLATTGDNQGMNLYK